MTEFRTTERAAFQKEVARAIPLLFDEDDALEPVIECLREAGYPVSKRTPAHGAGNTTTFPAVGSDNPTPALPASGEGESFPPLAGGLRGVSSGAGGLRGVQPQEWRPSGAPWPGILFEIVRRGPANFPSPAARRVAILLDELSETATIPPAVSNADGVLCADSRTVRRLKQRGVKASVLSFANTVQLVAKLAPRFDLMPGADLKSSPDQTDAQAPSITIVIAADPGDRLKRVLESALGQIYPGPVETIVAVTAAARNDALERASGEYIAVLSEVVSPWQLLTCVQALQQIGQLGVVFAPAGVLASGAQTKYPDAVPAPYGTVDLDFSGGAWAGPGAVAFQRSVVEGGIRYDETAPAGILDQEFRCRLDDLGYRVAALPAATGEPVPWPGEPFCAERVLEEEVAFFERHPHARLRGSLSLGLEPVEAGSVDALIATDGGDDEKLHQTRISLERQSYGGKINIIVCEDEAQSRLAGLLLDGVFVLMAPAGTLFSPQHIQNCVNLLRYQGASCICGSAAADLPDLEPELDEILTLLARWSHVQPIPMSGMPLGVPAPAGAWFMSRRLYDRARSELAQPAESTRADEERALQDAGGRMIAMDRLPVWRMMDREQRTIALMLTRTLSR